MNKAQSFSETTTLLDDPDPDIRVLAAEERASLTEVLSEHVNNVFPSLLVPPSTTKRFSAIVELKSGVGGDEAALFVADVLKMYTRLASARGFRVETVSISQLEGSKGSGGGIKEAIIEMQGEGAYDVFRWESGVHRVQRVPATESQGRVHTSTITVMVSWISRVISSRVANVLRARFSQHPTHRKRRKQTSKSTRKTSRPKSCEPEELVGR